MSESRDRNEMPVVLITGGAGYLGRRLTEELLGEGSFLEPKELRVFDLAEVPTSVEGVTWIFGDIRDFAALRRAFEGVDVVFHCAAIVDWGRCPGELLHAVNVEGTRNVVRACREAGVPFLVHTSTLDVVYDGCEVVDGDESLPYPSKPFNGYCRTKLDAERLVLRANGKRRSSRNGEGEAFLQTVAVRPSSIWGEADPFHIGSLLEMGQRGPVIRIGDGSGLSQLVYVGNVAHVHVLAARALLEGRPGVAGEAFFATDFPPTNFFDAFEPYVTAAGSRMLPWSLSLPYRPMYVLGGVMETLAWALRPVYNFVPIISRFAVDYVCQDFTFTGAKARERLGYEPRYSEHDAVGRTLRYYEMQ